MLDLIGEWQAHHRRSGDSINDVIASLLEVIDWNHVRPSALVDAAGKLLAGLPTAELIDVSHQAGRERKILADCAGAAAAEITDDQFTAAMPLSDRQLLTVLEWLGSRSEARVGALALLDPSGEESSPDSRVRELLLGAAGLVNTALDVIDTADRSEPRKVR